MNWIRKYFNRIHTRIALLLFAVTFLTVFLEMTFTRISFQNTQKQVVELVVMSVANNSERYLDLNGRMSQRRPDSPADIREGIRGKFDFVKNSFGKYLDSVIKSFGDDLDGEDDNGFFLLIMLVDADRKIVDSRLNKPLLRALKIDPETQKRIIPAFIDGGSGSLKLEQDRIIKSGNFVGSTNFHELYDGRILALQKPVISEDGKNVTGWVIAGILQKQLISFGAKTMKGFVAFGFILLIVVFILSYFVSRHITSPIPKLVEGMDRVRKGDFEASVDISRTDETGVLATAFNEMVIGLKRGLLVEKNFKKYVSRQVADEILTSGFATDKNAESRMVTVLFADIRNFTSISEKKSPEDVVAILNQYFSEMIDTIFKYNGTLDKFIGDAVMATFGVPKSYDDDAKRAVMCAIEMHRKLYALNRKGIFPSDVEIAIGIGINTGKAVAGTIGSSERLEYTVIGDTVNIASRLEGLNKEFNSKILISESTYREVASLVKVADLGEQKVKGRENKIKVYAVTGLLKTDDILGGDDKSANGV